MGTSALIAIKHENQYKFSTIIHMDGYPKWTGRELINSIKAELNRELLLASLDLVKTVEDNPTEIYSAELISTLQDKPESVTYRTDDLWFGDNSLFCEWAYVLDFDSNTFEVFKGGNLEPLNENDRFYFTQAEGAEYREEQKQMLGRCYYPIRLIASYSLDDLPSEEEIKSLDDYYFLALKNFDGVKVIGMQKHSGGLHIAGKELLEHLNTHGANSLFLTSNMAIDTQPLTQLGLKESIEGFLNYENKPVFARNLGKFNDCEWGYLINKDDQTLQIYINSYLAKHFYGYLVQDCTRELLGHILMLSYPLNQLPTIEQIKADMEHLKPETEKKKSKK